ncbi:MAG: YigZ family protein [Bacteroidales bacterium]|nr:YigZ family protein [Bacteroidales bacterium]
MSEEKHISTDHYRSISALSTGSYRDNGSKFLAFAYPVESEEEIREKLAALRKEYFDARHHCYAWRLGLKGEPWRANDDGEPSSTAGRPILGQILSAELSDILVVVVRYFGGIKLGVPGLIKAYKTATAEALAAATVVEKTACVTFRVRFGYLQMNDLMKVIKDLDLKILSQHFENECELTVNVGLAKVDTFQENLRWAKVEII